MIGRRLSSGQRAAAAAHSISIVVDGSTAAVDLRSCEARLAVGIDRIAMQSFV